MLRIVPITSPKARDAIRDAVIDQVHATSLEKVRDSIMADLVAWRTESDPYLRRRKWCYSVLFSKAELRRYADAILRALGIDERTSPGSPIGASGQMPSQGSATGGWLWLTGHRPTSDLAWSQEYHYYEFDDEDQAGQFQERIEERGVPTFGMLETITGQWKVLIPSSYFSD